MIHVKKEYNRLNDPDQVIGEDEPVFILRGSDLLAPATLLYWADRMDKTGGDKEFIAMAKKHAFDMLYWQVKNHAKLQTL